MLRSTISRSLREPLCRQFSVSTAVGEHNVNRLGVIGAGQMVGWGFQCDMFQGGRVKGC